MQATAKDIENQQSAESVVDPELENIRLLLRNDPSEALRRARRFADEARLKNRKLSLAYALQICGMALFDLGSSDEIEDVLAQAEILYRELDDDLGICDVFYWQGLIAHKRLQLAKAYSKLSDARSILERINRPERLGNVIDAIGVVYIQAEEFDKALEHCLEALRLREEQTEMANLASSLNNLGTLYFDLKDLHKAKDYLQRALAMQRESNDKVGLAGTSLNVGSIYIELDQPQKALEFLEESLALRQEIGNPVDIAESLTAIGKAYECKSQYSVAIRYQRRGLALARQSGNVRICADYLLNLARMLDTCGEHDQAFAACNEATALVEQLDLHQPQYELHKVLARLYTGQGNYQRALEHQERSEGHYKNILGAERQRAIASVEMRLQLTRVEQERELLRRRAEQAEREAEFNKKQLSATALNLAYRNEALRSLKSMMTAHAARDDADGTDLAQEALHFIDRVAGKSEEWAVFEEQFERVHEAFIRKLLKRADKLTPTEVKVCVLIRLNLPSKQIADLMFSSLFTVKTHRTRIRKKLGLGSGDNLASFLMLL